MDKVAHVAIEASSVLPGFLVTYCRSLPPAARGSVESSGALELL